MHSQVLKQSLLGFKVFLVALGAGLAPQQHLQMGLQVHLETLKTGKSQVTLVARIIPIAPHGRSRVSSQSVALWRRDLDIRGGGAEICNLCLPFVVSQWDVLVVLLNVLGELEE